MSQRLEAVVSGLSVNPLVRVEAHLLPVQWCITYWYSMILRIDISPLQVSVEMEVFYQSRQLSSHCDLLVCTEYLYGVPVRSTEVW
jgi:hypothetical protein